MPKNNKSSGQIFTPNYLVKVILDFCGYSSQAIQSKHIIDNSCGDGAFLIEIVDRYCNSYYASTYSLKEDLETYIHGIEIDENAYRSCIRNLDKVAARYGLKDVKWDVRNGDTLCISDYNGNMDYVVGNPPYVRVHNLDNYDMVKKYRFAQGGMTDLYIVFFEIGFKMLSPRGKMCIITPGSWLSSNAGIALRQYISSHKNLLGLIDLEHFQPFQATTYTLISLFENGLNHKQIMYNTYDGEKNRVVFQDNLSYEDIEISNNFYLSSKQNLTILKEIQFSSISKAAKVKNGFATLADKVFIGDFNFNEGLIDIIKASTGKWTKCIFPYNKKGNPLQWSDILKNKRLSEYMLRHEERLTKNRDIENKSQWFLFGRTQAINDVFKDKIAINSIIKDKNSIKLNIVEKGKGVYSGLYILTDIQYNIIKEILISDEFIEYVKILKNYKSGGYYTFSSKELERYINYKLKDYNNEQFGLSKSYIPFV